MSKSSITTAVDARMPPVHPGRILKRELTARSLSANQLAIAIRVPSGRITSILNGQRSITAETALRLARFFGNSAQFWMNLQTRFDLLSAEAQIGSQIIAEVAEAG
jgi:addiction module HigA family antidote